MTRLNFENSNSPKEQDWALDSQETKRKFLFSTSPRLVGGTTFVNHAALDQTQVKLLADAAIHSMNETRKILLNWRRQGQCLSDIYLHGIAQSTRLIGELWSSDELDFASGNIAYTHLHLAMLELSAEFLSEGRTEDNGYSLLLMTEPGSQHGMGAFMLGEFFRRSGWRVTLAAPQDIVDFKRWFMSDWFDAAVLSISTDRQIDHIAKAVSELHNATVNPNLKVFVGGLMTSILPDRLNWPGIVTLHSEAEETVEMVSQAMVSASTPSKTYSSPAAIPS